MFCVFFRLLHYNDILPMDEAASEEPISVPTKSDKLEQLKKKKIIVRHLSETDSQNSAENSDEKTDKLISDRNWQSKSRSESPTDEYNVVDYNTLIPAIAMDCGSDTESKKESPKTQTVIIKKILKNDKVCNKESFEFHNSLKILVSQ